jgi:3-deoxy-manno-octulosonate cytidylyltransferase (CMP-KDO synthetase)
VLAIAGVLEGHDERMGTLAYPVRDKSEFGNPNLVKVVLDHAGCALYFSRARIPYARGEDADDTPAYAEGVWCLGHMGVYAYRRDLLLAYHEFPASSLEAREKLEQLRAVEAGERIRVAVVDPPHGRPVDTAEDYQAFVKRRAARGS